MTWFQARTTHACVSAVLAAASLFGVAGDAGAQSFWDRLIIRQNLDSKKDVPKPAFAQVTVPDEGDAVYNVGIGVTVAAVSTDLVTFGPAVEYLRNTQVSKAVDSPKVGAELQWQLREISAFTMTRTSGLLVGRATLRRDGVKDARGFQGAIGYTHVFSGVGPPFRPNVTFGSDSVATIVYSPQAAFEVDLVGGAADPGNEGAIVRPVALVDVASYIAPGALRNRLEVTVNSALRIDAVDTTSAADDVHPFVTAGLTYYFVREGRRVAGVGVTYLAGDDPDKGFASQRIWQFGLKLQLK